MYRIRELKEICDYAHAHRMYVHMDGARLSNAVAYLGCDPRDITSRVGIDVLSFGGTKNGMMFGEAVVFFNPEVAKEVQYIRKQLIGSSTFHRRPIFGSPETQPLAKDRRTCQPDGPDVSQRSG